MNEAAAPVRVNWHTSLREPRVGVMLHYSDGSFEGGITWCKNPVSEVSYNVLIAQDGRLAPIAPDTARAWHAGVCRPSAPPLAYTDADSAFYGVALAASAGDTCAPAAFFAIVTQVRKYFAANGWPPTELWRVTGHDAEAWPRGRKIDPTGPKKSSPVLSVARVRAALYPTAIGG